MSNPNYSISTPENVDLHLELAGMANRCLAALVDYVFIGILVSLLVLAGIAVEMGLNQLGSGLAKGISSTVTNYIVAVVILLSFLIIFGYFIVFEHFWRGRTPGKKIFKIKVLMANGRPVNVQAVFIRNLIRLIDVGISLVGVLFLFLDKKERRLGDLAAATIVVKEQRNPFTVYEISQAARQSDLGGLDVKRLGLADYEALLAYLKRRHEIEQFFRSRIAKSLVDHLRRKLDVDAMLVEQSTPEIFLEKVYLAYSKYRKQQDENQENQENQDFPDSEE